MARHGLTWNEKTLGQLFCDQKSGAVIQLLLDELAATGGELRLETDVTGVHHADSLFHVTTSKGNASARNLVVATGGLSIPKMGATGLAYDLARQFGHAVIQPRPALVPFTFSGALKDTFSSLSGVSTSVEAAAARGPGFHEAMLFTHRGLSGPAMLQVSSFWRESEPVTIDLAPGQSLAAHLHKARDTSPRTSLKSWLAGWLPARFADHAASWPGIPGGKQLANLSNGEIGTISAALKTWKLTPAGTEGWRTAEVTAGGVDTDGLSSRSMESKRVPGLYFIGECVDVTGWLGGYNFQWAWASAAAAGEAIAASGKDS